MFRSFGAWEIALILVIVLIIFGAGKLPQVGSSIGKALRSFRQGQHGEEASEDEESKTKKSTAKSKKVVQTTAK